MTEVKRPRVAAIGLDEAQAASIQSMCGVLRVAKTLTAYSGDYSWTETDILVAGDFYSPERIDDVHLLTIGSMQCGSWVPGPGRENHFVGMGRTMSHNREREVSVSVECPPLYSTLASRLSNDLSRNENPPSVFLFEEWIEPYRESLIATSYSEQCVAARLQLTEPHVPVARTGASVDRIALLLPMVSNLSEWFRAFLTDIHNIDPFGVPQLPPRLSVPSAWYTPAENALAERIDAIDRETERLLHERQNIKARLTAEGDRADAGIKRAIWSDGDELVEAVSEILSDIGFSVRSMDAEVKEGERKREDLRLTLESRPDWEAIVEIKGYTKGTRTNDAGRIRAHRERYIQEEHRLPDLTIWVVNEYREEDPSFRRSTRTDVGKDAANVGAVHVLSTDLYKQWAFVKRGKLDAGDVIQRLMDAEPGLWQPSSKLPNG